MAGPGLAVFHARWLEVVVRVGQRHPERRKNEGRRKQGERVGNEKGKPTSWGCAVGTNSRPLDSAPDRQNLNGPTELTLLLCLLFFLLTFFYPPPFPSFSPLSFLLFPLFLSPLLPFPPLSLTSFLSPPFAAAPTRPHRGSAHGPGRESQQTSTSGCRYAPRAPVDLSQRPEPARARSEPPNYYPNGEPGGVGRLLLGLCHEPAHYET